MSTWIVKVCLMVKELIPANVCLQWVCLVPGEKNDLATYRRGDVPLSSLPLTDVEGVIYHMRSRPLVWLGLHQTFQASSLCLLCIELQPLALLQGCGRAENMCLHLPK